MSRDARQNNSGQNFWVITVFSMHVQAGWTCLHCPVTRPLDLCDPYSIQWIWHNLPTSRMEFYSAPLYQGTFVMVRPTNLFTQQRKLALQFNVIAFSKSFCLLMLYPGDKPHWRVNYEPPQTVMSRITWARSEDRSASQLFSLIRAYSSRIRYQWALFYAHRTRSDTQANHSIRGWYIAPFSWSTAERCWLMSDLILIVEFDFLMENTWWLKSGSIHIRGMRHRHGEQTWIRNDKQVNQVSFGRCIAEMWDPWKS